MYMTNEDYEFLDQLSNTLTHDQYHDFHDLLQKASKEESRDDVLVIYVRDQAELLEKAIEPRLIITREMIEKAYNDAKNK